MVLDYRSDFLAPAEAERLFDHLLRVVDWRCEVLRLYGREVPVPRLLAWYGDAGINYRYSGADHICDGWLQALQPVRARIARDLDLASNLVLLNRYRGGADYMGWHSDDERAHGATVVSLSLGATRRFLVRVPGESSSRRLNLESGSVLVMDGRLRHSLPPTRRPVGERINLTFRHIRVAA